MNTKDKNQAEGDGHDVPFRWWVWAIIGVVVVWGGSALLISLYSGAGATALGERGTFGDMFGAVNALFSGLAFATLIYTVLQQRAELRATREEMRQQSKEWVKQNAVLTQQAFDGSFFQMLKMLEDAAQSVFVKHDRFMAKGHWETPEGAAAFQLILQEFIELREISRASTFYEDATELQIMRDTITSSMEKYGVGFFRYLDALTNIAEFVVRSGPSKTKLYARLMRSQMSHDQLRFVFYVCVSLDAHKALRLNLDRLSFFESLPEELFIHRRHKTIYYDLEVGS